MQTANDFQPDAQHPIPQLPRQCAWCGLRMDGPLAGLRATDANGEPQMLLGYTHGFCGECREAWLASYHQRDDARH